MARINMKQELVSVLETVPGLADFSTDYPREMTSFPYAVYRTVATPHFLDANREEVQTRWTIVIEVYGTKSVANLVADISTKMTAYGFRVIQRDSNTADLKRIVLECQGIVDNVMKHVYLTN